MYIARVTLGNAFVISKATPKGTRRPPDLNGDFNPVSATRLHDSIVFDGTRKRYKEFMIYDRTQCYPEFLVEYKRLE